MAHDKTVLISLPTVIDSASPRLESRSVIALCSTSLPTKHNASTDLYEQKLAALEALKKSLLHQAFTGQL